MTPDHLTLLAQAAASGDDHALEQLVAATQDRIHRLCTHLGSPAEADDLTQETYLKALQALPRFRGESPVLVWLMAIARHTCADHVRRKVRRAEIDRARRPRGAVSHPDDSIIVSDLLGRLDPDQATAIVLTQLVGLSYEEAAGVCECPVGTIRSRVARARAALMADVRAADAG